MKILLTTLIISIASFNAYSVQSSFRTRAPQLKKSDYTDSDIEAEIKFGRNLAARILGRYALVSDEKAQEYVRLIGTGIAAQIGRPELKFYFGIIKTKDVNAYACPGGYIFITQGAIEKMNNEAELAGVLAHEITHINSRHVVKQINLKAKEGGLGSITGGASASVRVALEQVLDNAMKALFEKGVEKEDEFESDRVATETLINLGYNWKKYVQYINNLKYSIKSGEGEVLSKTHPTPSERVQMIKDSVKKLEIANYTGKNNKTRFRRNVKF
jgi:predicted Zn-dependent protease